MGLFSTLRFRNDALTPVVRSRKVLIAASPIRSGAVSNEY
jgi:hypothetical protein